MLPCPGVLGENATAEELKTQLEGESFSICDPNEVWILELIGKRQGTVKPELAKKLKYKYTDGAV